MSECDQLKKEIAALRAEIAKLKPLDQGKFNSMLLAGAGVLGGMFVTHPEILRMQQSIKSFAQYQDAIARRKAEDALMQADLAIRKAQLAENTAQGAQRAVTGLGQKLQNFEARINSILNGIRKRIDDLVQGIARAIRKAAEASELGRRALRYIDDIAPIAKRALSTALKVLGMVLNILDLIAGLATLAEVQGLRKRMQALEKAQDVLSRDMSRILTIIQSLKSYLDSLSDRITGVNSRLNSLGSWVQDIARNVSEALTKSASALSKSAEAQSTATQAQSTSMQAAQSAAVAVATASAAQAAIAGVGSIARNALGRASAANSKADTAIGMARRAGTGRNGRDGRDGRQGERGPRGFMGLRGRTGPAGQPGRVGAPGPAGQPGRAGQRGPQGSPGRDGRPGRDGKDGKDGKMDAADKALLRKIDRTTTSTNRLSRLMSPVVIATRTIALKTQQTLTLLDTFTRAAWKFTRMDKVVSALTLVVTLHNASMLTRELGETLGELTAQVLNVIGIRDEEGNALDVNGLVGSTFENLIISILGAEVYAGVKLQWLRANRILQAGSQVIWTVRSIMDSTAEVEEWIAENLGKIGNALKKYGVVGRAAYPAMSERMRAQERWRNKLGRVTDGLESLEDTASSLYAVTSEVREAQEEIGELGQNAAQFRGMVTGEIDPSTGQPYLPPEPRQPVDNAEVAAAAAAAAAASQSPEISTADMNRG